MAMLTGQELLDYAKNNEKSSKSELVRGAGYVTTKKDGTERLNFTAFYEALLEAKGLNVGGNTSNGRRGRKLSFRTKVQFNGNLLVGAAYTAQLGLKPGDEFEIKLGRKQIKLLPVGAGGDAAADEDGDDAAIETTAADLPFTDAAEPEEIEEEELDEALNEALEEELVPA